ncbi:N-acetylmuramoyl-L-alanine amidase [Pseudoxanthomonas kalamensis DSM 18571]|nr:N-acetylmuramoyl-L-alanine amidase [Pseudoxanthomonas kalamensis DSM 18571]
MGMRPGRYRQWVRALAAGLAVVALAGCVSSGPRNPMADWVRSKNYDVRRPVLIVLHYTEQDSVEQSLHTLRNRNSGGRVSSHYLVGKDGSLYQLVSDEKRAWHAGAGRWGTITDVNSASIGIEIDNDGKSPYPQAQIETLLKLLDDLCTRWQIPRSQVIGHSDLAPRRKVDPGPLFPWKQLADAGFGVWPAADAGDPAPGFDPWLAMQAIGYDLQDRAAAVRSFHHHFRGMEGVELDAEDLRVLWALTRLPAGDVQP